MKKLKLDDKESTKLEIQNFFKQHSLARFIHRLQAILYIAEGHDCYEAARAFNHSPRTIHAWVKIVNEQGIHALKDEKRPGRPSRLTPEIKMIFS